MKSLNKIHSISQVSDILLILCPYHSHHLFIHIHNLEGTRPNRIHLHNIPKISEYSNLRFTCPQGCWINKWPDLGKGYTFIPSLLPFSEDLNALSSQGSGGYSDGDKSGNLKEGLTAYLNLSSLLGWSLERELWIIVEVFTSPKPPGTCLGLMVRKYATSQSFVICSIQCFHSHRWNRAEDRLHLHATIPKMKNKIKPHVLQ